jgi:hypothetical protein
MQPGALVTVKEQVVTGAGEGIVVSFLVQKC